MNQYGLSERDLEICALASLELSDDEIANFIHRAPITVKTIMKNIREKIGAKSKVGLAVFAVKNQLT